MIFFLLRLFAREKTLDGYARGRYMDVMVTMTTTMMMMMLLREGRISLQSLIIVISRSLYMLVIEYFLEYLLARFVSLLLLTRYIMYTTRPQSRKIQYNSGSTYVSLATYKIKLIQVYHILYNLR